MSRESPNHTSNDLRGLNVVQVTSSTSKVTPRSQQRFENLLSQPAGGAQPRDRDLVLQMYTHVKTHRRLEQERVIRLSKAARRRQAKQEAFSFILSPSRLNREWQGGHSNTGPGPGTDVNFEDSTYANTEAGTDSNNDMAESVGLRDVGAHSQTGSINCETSATEISSSTRKSNANLRTSCSDSELTPDPIEELDLMTGSKDDSGHTSLMGSRVNSRRDEAASTEQRHRIQFHHTASPRSVAGESRVKIHWDNVKAGAVVPAPVSVVTFDGGLFT